MLPNSVCVCRLPMKAVLSKLARQRTTDATFVRIWLAERLERELKAE